MLKKLLKEPLVHFLLIGGVLFIAYGALNRSKEVSGDYEVLVTEQRIEQLAAIFSKSWQRPPTPQELKGLVDDFVLEELYYREAKRMGIDEDDTVIRRRLRQKMEFLSTDLASLLNPKDSELNSYLLDHEEQFARPARLSFRQVYINPERHEDPELAVQQALDSLRNGEPVHGDSSLLPGDFEDSPRPIVDRTFGPEFSTQLLDLPQGEWQGPVKSAFGRHLVLIESYEPQRAPELDEVRNDVEREWLNVQRQRIQDEFNEQLLQKYQVEVEWPSAEDGKHS